MEPPLGLGTAEWLSIGSLTLAAISLVIVLRELIGALRVKFSTAHPVDEILTIRVDDTLLCNLTIRNLGRTHRMIRLPLVRGFFHLGSRLNPESRFTREGEEFGIQAGRMEDTLTGTAYPPTQWIEVPPGKSFLFKIQHQVRKPIHHVFYQYVVVDERGREHRSKKYRLCINPKEAAATTSNPAATEPPAE